MDERCCVYQCKAGIDTDLVKEGNIYLKTIGAAKNHISILEYIILRHEISKNLTF